MEFLMLAKCIWNILTMWSNSLSLTALRKWIICYLNSGNMKQFKSFSWNTVFQTPNAQCGINLCDYSQYNYVANVYSIEVKIETKLRTINFTGTRKLSYEQFLSKTSIYSKILHWIWFNFDNTALKAIKICN